MSEEEMEPLEQELDLEALRARAAQMTENALKRHVNGLRQQINARERDLKDCFSQLNLHRSGLSEFIERRDELNAEVKALFESANQEKGIRNEINDRISVLKRERQQLRSECDEMVERIDELKAKRDKYNSLSRGRLGVLSQDYLRELDVFLNADIPLAHEINVYERLKELGERIGAARKAEKLHQEVSRTYTACKACSPRIRAINGEIKALSDESQSHHLKMVELYQKARALRKEADIYHRRLKEKYEEMSPIRDKVDTTKHALRLLRTEVSVFLERLDETQLTRKDKKEKKKLEDAKEKLKQSRGLSLDDLKVLMEDGSLKLE
ncbi:MAG: coiled-coil protein [Methermicoccaceae archaeon]